MSHHFLHVGSGDEAGVDASRDVLADRLESATPKHSELTLVHGDYHQLNCGLDPASCEVRAVLKWELCTLGDPPADLGTLLA